MVDLVELDTEAAWEKARLVRPKLKPYTIAELHTLPRRTWLVKGYLDKGGLSVIYGDSNSGKSFFALDLALHLALGWDWRGRRVEQCPVCYIASEGGLGLVERLTAFRYRHGIDINKWNDLPFLLIPDRADFCTSPNDAETIINHCREMEIKPGFFGVDTLSATIGGGNESAAPDMNTYVGNVAKLSATGAHSLIVHHSGKDTAKGARGSSTLRAATDTESECVEDRDGARTVTVTKQRDGVRDDEFHFTLDVVDIGQDEDGDTITSCIVLPSDTGPGRRTDRDKRPKLTTLQKKGLDGLHNCLINQPRPAPDDVHYPPGAIVVPSEVWREELARSAVLSTDNKATARQQWGRIRAGLMDAGVIREYRDLIWIVKVQDT